MREQRMKKFLVYTGDGNDGTSFDHEIEAETLDEAVEAYKEDIPEDQRHLFSEDEGDETYAVLTVLEDEDGATAYNGGAFFIAEIYDAETCPRGRW
jgi:hypothetical protein